MKTNKLYKYRPLSDFLFKELRYNELYFASYTELNDPLDLSSRIDFKPTDKKQLEYLIHFLIKTSINLSSNINSESGRNYIQKIIKLSKNIELRGEICSRLYSYLRAQNYDFISLDIIEENIKKVSKEFQIEFKLENFNDEVQRITKVFFESSFATCFSSTCTDFLMWSHYASKHTGICIEFSLDHKEHFPYFSVGNRKPDEKKYLEKYSEWELKGHLYWDKINEVKYQKNLPSINFYDFSAVFENENDCDLMGLSKSWWHGYDHELERVFSVKTLPWKYEKEWRAIEINFGELKEPEDRIRHYPIKALTGIYFGIRTPNKVKNRIYKILNSKNENIDYFDCQLSSNRNLELNEWEYDDD